MQLRVGLHLGFITCIASVLVAWSNVGLPRTVQLEAGGEPSIHTTRQLQVGGFLKQTGVELAPGDLVYPPIGSSPENAVRVVRALPVTLVQNGAVRDMRTTASSIGGFLDEMGVKVGPHDLLTLDGRPTTPRAVFPAAEHTATGRGVVMEVRTAKPIYIHDAGSVHEVPAVAPTVYLAIYQAGIQVHPGDLISPDPSLPVRQGAHIYIDRAKEVTVSADGEQRTHRTRAETVQEALREAGVVVSSLDRVSPPEDGALEHKAELRVIRVAEARLVEQEILPFDTRREPDEGMERGQQHVAEPGGEGLYVREYLVRFEESEEVARTVEREYLEREPTPRVIRYGTKVVPHYVDTGLGSQEYHQVLRVWATWYNPRSAGKPAWHPGYGITSTGMPVRRGIVAVDPRVIPYYTQMYIPGYGHAIAGDTGGGIRGNKIDLGFADDEYPDWGTGWVDIYLLGPPPLGS